MTEDERREQVVKIAISAVEEFVKHSRVLVLAPEMREALGGPAACFVSLKMSGELRGCIGTLEPTRTDLAEEIVHNAISACSRDPRFTPVREGELSDLKFSVDVLESPEKVSSMSELDPKIFGVIVSSGSARGVLLPDLEGIDTAEKQVQIACHKAGIHPHIPLEIERFRVRRYSQ